MGLPITFLLGAAILLLHDQLCESLPGAATWHRLWPYLLLGPVPWLLVRSLGGRLRRQPGRSPLGRLLLIRLLPWTVPALYAAMVLLGGLPPFALALAGDSSVLFLTVALTPLLVMEVSYRFGERVLVGAAARRGVVLPSALGQLPLVWLVVLPILVMAALADATRMHRGLHVFLTSTALGHLCGFLATVLLLSLMLPLLFRWLLPTSRQLPPSVAGEVHATARALGFPPRAVLALRTDLRMANAALVGPLPWPRYLVLTDALMAMLEPFALRGVVAHEVGHARAGHPGLLMVAFVVVPLLSYHGLWLWLHDADTTTIVATWLAIAIVALAALRLLAHRFEYEADQLSASALGGALPCIEALRRVGQLGAHSSGRGTLRHPADGRRILQLQRWEQDPHERARFARQGRYVRILIGAVAVLATIGCAWAQLRVWPVDRVLLAFYTGAFPEASVRLQELPPVVPPSLTELVADLRQEIDAARTLVPEGGPWEVVRDRLSAGGIERGVRRLSEGNAKAALPWLSLSLSRPENEPWRQTLYLLADAAAEGDHEHLNRLREHLASLAPPSEVWDAVKDLVPQPSDR